MDKSIIKQFLHETFVKEASDPAIKLTSKLKNDNAKVNKDGLSDMAKDMKAYEKPLKPDANAKDMGPNKFNYTDKEEKTYHDEMEIMNGQEMIQYDREPDAEYKKRAEEGIAGSSRMGNNPEWANVVEKGWGGDKNFGKDLVKKIKASAKKRSAETPITKMYGSDWEIVADKGHKPYAVENKETKGKVITEALSEKNIRVITSWIEKMGPEEAAIKLINGVSQTGLVSDLPDSNQYGDAIRKITALLSKKDLERAYETAKKSAKSLERRAMRGDMDENAELDEYGKPKSLMADRHYTHFAIYKPTNQIMNGWNYKGYDAEELKSSPREYFFDDLADFIDNGVSKKEIKIITRKALDRAGINPEDIKNWYRPSEGESNEAPAPDTDNNSYAVAKTADTSVPENPVHENKNKTQKQIKESMKRLKFKKEFKGMGNALNLIPEAYKVDGKVFEMTDGNESYKIRWEGQLTEGKAVVLQAADKNLINEDIQKMKHLFNYKSKDTLGGSKRVSRVDESKIFADIFKKTKNLLEGEDIDGQDAPIEEDDTLNQAPEAKKHIEGSVSTDDGTDAPAPKNGDWEKIAVKQAPEAKKHIEGSVPDSKKTEAPAPKTGDWDKIKVKQASEASKDIKKM